MKLGMTGAGMIVKELLSFITDIKGIDLEAIYARTNENGRLEQLCKEYGIKRFYTDYDQMLTNREIDTIYIGISNHMHFEFAKKALLAGKHVICEKPFTVTMEEFDELCTLAKKHHLFLLEAISNQYIPNYLRIKEEIKRLGNIRIVTCNYSQYSSRYDAFLQGDIKPAFDINQAGGALRDLNVYNIHFVVGLFGEPKAVKYYPNVVSGIDVSGILTMEYPDLQCVCIGAKDCSASIQSNIQGDKGYLCMAYPTNSCDGFSVCLNQKEPVEIQENQGKHRMFYEFVEFERMIREQDLEEIQRKLDQSRVVMKILASVSYQW
ncbi:MAG: Gfo/Idh/MocA family oxidoreductase [Lachnospiraceae bacterium]|nr:Gfo/Idh/MocA family oxidoreductase [Lachnospiraceae bacterium]